MNKTNLFYANAKPGETFRIGPFATREDAAEETPIQMAMSPGQKFEVGICEMFEPEVEKTFIELMVKQAADHPATPEAARWVRNFTTHPDLDTLRAGLKAQFAGWLLMNDLLPKFGTVTEISLHTA